MPAVVYIALGGNLGDTRRIFEQAVAALNDLPEFKLIKTSGLYETTPVGGPTHQPKYLNAVIAAESEMPPQELLQTMQQVEKDRGRRPSGRWQPRTLDLDLLFYDRLIIVEEQLQIPHLRLHQRRFVLEPLAEIAPELIHPSFEKTVSELLSQLESANETVSKISGPDW